MATNWVAYIPYDGEEPFVNIGNIPHFALLEEGMPELRAETNLIAAGYLPQSSQGVFAKGEITPGGYVKFDAAQGDRNVIADVVYDFLRRTASKKESDKPLANPPTILEYFINYGNSVERPNEYDIETIVEFGMGLGSLPRDEMGEYLERLMATDHPAAAIRLAQETNCLRFMMPLVEESKGFWQRYKNTSSELFQHLLLTLEYAAAYSNDRDLRWAALLHDIGKIRSVWVDEDGRTRFRKGPEGQGANHEEVGPEMALEMFNDLGITNYDRILLFIRNHMFEHFTKKKDAKKFVEFMGGKQNALDMLILRGGDVQGKPGQKDAEKEIEEMTELVEKITSDDEDVQYKEDAGLDKIVFVYVGGKEAGYINYDPTPDYIEIKTLQIYPKFRRRGLATDLLQRVSSKFPKLPIKTEAVTPLGKVFVNSYINQFGDKVVWEKDTRPWQKGDLPDRHAAVQTPEEAIAEIKKHIFNKSFEEKFKDILLTKTHYKETDIDRVYEKIHLALDRLPDKDIIIDFPTSISESEIIPSYTEYAEKLLEAFNSPKIAKWLESADQLPNWVENQTQRSLDSSLQELLEAKEEGYPYDEDTLSEIFYISNIVRDYNIPTGLPEYRTPEAWLRYLRADSKGRQKRYRQTSRVAGEGGYKVWYNFFEEFANTILNDGVAENFADEIDQDTEARTVISLLYSIITWDALSSKKKILSGSYDFNSMSPKSIELATNPYRLFANYRRYEIHIENLYGPKKTKEELGSYIQNSNSIGGVYAYERAYRAAITALAIYSQRSRKISAREIAKKIDIGGVKLEVPIPEEYVKDGWEFYRLVEREDYETESTILDHCIGRDDMEYYEDAQERKRTVDVSIRQYGVPQATATFINDTEQNHREIAAFHGDSNAEPPYHCMQMLWFLASHMDIVLPDDYLEAIGTENAKEYAQIDFDLDPTSAEKYYRTEKDINALGKYAYQRYIPDIGSIDEYMEKYSIEEVMQGMRYAAEGNRDHVDPDVYPLSPRVTVSHIGNAFLDQGFEIIRYRPTFARYISAYMNTDFCDQADANFKSEIALEELFNIGNADFEIAKILSEYKPTLFGEEDRQEEVINDLYYNVDRIVEIVAGAGMGSSTAIGEDFIDALLSPQARTQFLFGDLRRSSGRFERQIARAIWKMFDRIEDYIELMNQPEIVEDRDTNVSRDVAAASFLLALATEKNHAIFASTQDTFANLSTINQHKNDFIRSVVVAASTRYHSVRVLNAWRNPDTVVGDWNGLLENLPVANLLFNLAPYAVYDEIVKQNKWGELLDFLKADIRYPGDEEGSETFQKFLDSFTKEFLNTDIVGEETQPEEKDEEVEQLQLFEFNEIKAPIWWLSEYEGKPFYFPHSRGISLYPKLSPNTKILDVRKAFNISFRFYSNANDSEKLAALEDFNVLPYLDSVTEERSFAELVNPQLKNGYINDVYTAVLFNEIIANKIEKDLTGHFRRYLNEFGLSSRYLDDAYINSMREIYAQAKRMFFYYSDREFERQFEESPVVPTPENIADYADLVVGTFNLITEKKAVDAFADNEWLSFNLRKILGSNSIEIMAKYAGETPEIIQARKNISEWLSKINARIEQEKAQPQQEVAPAQGWPPVEHAVLEEVPPQEGFLDRLDRADENQML